MKKILLPLVLGLITWCVILNANCSRLVNNLCIFRNDDYQEALPREKILIPMNDYIVPGYIFRPFKSAAQYPAVVMAHTLGGSKEDQTNLLARRIAKKGFLTIILDLDGHGNNPHPFDDESILSNIPRAVDYLYTLKDVDQNNIFVVGANLGAVLGIKAGAVDWRIKGIVAIEGLYKVDINLFQFIAEANIFHLLQPSQVRFGDDKGMAISLLNARLDKWDILKSIAQVSPRAMLLIHGEKDGLISLDQVQALYNNARHPRELKVIPHEKYHTLLLNKDMTDYIVAWLKSKCT